MKQNTFEHHGVIFMAVPDKTKHDYDAVMKSYMSCKKFELEKALQEN